ncbi:MAG: hypothetical protein ACUVRZ_07515, partial [Desulfobacca sp.]|uniref:hypothetical protein n=1 Tax=Desulfobacca sp. TaxID=2067990 RepID=UPI00404B5707
MLLYGLGAAAPTWAQPQPKTTPLPTPPQSTLLPEIAKTLQKQIQEFTAQGEMAERRLAQAREESQSLAVAVSTHKTALSLDKVTVEQAKELQQYYARLLAQRAKDAANLEQEQEKFGKILTELTEASKSTELEKAKQPPAKTPAQRALEQQRQQSQTLASTAIKRLEELQKILQAHVELLSQEKELLTDFTLQLEDYVAEKSRQQLLERQRPSDLIALAREGIAAGLALPGKLLEMVQENIASGNAGRLLRQYRSELFGLLIFLALLLYSMRLLRRASREFRQNLEFKAKNFSLKLIIAVVNALAHN